MGAPARIALFLDCNFCDETFIRQEMPYVDHVRDREVANVHVLVTQEETGSGGEALTIDLIGLGIFGGLDFSTVFNAPANASDAEERDRFLRTLEAALVYRTLPSLFPLRLVHNQISLRVQKMSLVNNPG